MSLLTFQILEGMERGRVIHEIKPPITIGREEDNAIQLNDERVSRFHAKIQEDGGKIILTDLESTNGTRVNGHPVKMHVMQIGDQVSVGRCMLLYGSAAEIEARIRTLPAIEDNGNGNGTVSFASDVVDPAGSVGQSADEEVPKMFPAGAPELPQGLRPVQVAQLSDILAHIHDRLQSVANSGRGGKPDEKAPADKPPVPVEVDWPVWQRLLKLEMDIATYLRHLTDSSSSGG